MVLNLTKKETIEKLVILVIFSSAEGAKMTNYAMLK